MKKSWSAIAGALVARCVGSVVGAVPAGAGTSEDQMLSVANAARAKYGATALT
ncbi:hypothetical protein ACQPW1_19345 [Nocardia sp. CA-128927]|uniref:hypothetical protein n=1 Tax=Nocardia sp. CA-128927 TaxID=3239975 RepID=UPI003D966270